MAIGFFKANWMRAALAGAASHAMIAMGADPVLRWSRCDAALPPESAARFVRLEPVTAPMGLDVVIPDGNSCRVLPWDPASSSWKAAMTVKAPESKGPSFFGMLRYGAPLRRPAWVTGDGVWLSEAPTVAPKLVLARPIPLPASMSSVDAEIGVDVDGDGMDELLVPDKQSVSLLKSDGHGRWQALAVPTVSGGGQWRMYPQFGAARPNVMLGRSSSQGIDGFTLLDVSGDGKLDLVQVSESPGNAATNVETYLCRANGGYGTKPDRRWTFPFSPGADVVPMMLAPQRPGVLRVVSNLDLLSPKTVVSVYGADKTPAARLTTRDPLGTAAWADLNNDRLPDLVLFQFRFPAGSATDMANLALGKPVPYRLVFALNVDGKYAETATMPLELNVSLDSSAPRRQPPFFVAGDMTGDGLPEIASRPTDTRVEIHAANSPGVYTPRPVASLDVAADAYVYTADVNGDGRLDIIEKSAEENRLSAYIVRLP